MLGSQIDSSSLENVRNAAPRFNFFGTSKEANYAFQPSQVMRRPSGNGRLSNLTKRL